MKARPAMPSEDKQTLQPQGPRAPSNAALDSTVSKGVADGDKGNEGLTSNRSQAVTPKVTPAVYPPRLRWHI